MGDGMPSDGTLPSLYLIDAHALIFQVFHAIPEMSSPSGLPTNALFGFTRDLLFLRTEKKPDYLVCAFDQNEPTFRSELYPDYKAHRPAMPTDLPPQIPQIVRLLEAMRVPVLSHPRFEADDILATLAVEGERRGLDVLLCTSDKDCRQLITDRVRMYNFRKHAVFDRDALLKDWGVTPEQVVDFQTLVGDSVDNVPGVEGIGPKTAAKLLQEFGTLDNIVANLDTLVESRRLRSGLVENLRASLDKLKVSRQLVRLETRMPLEWDADAWRLQEWDAPRLLELFKEWGFHRFAEDVRRLAGLLRTGGDKPGEAAVQQGLFDGMETFPFGAHAPAEATENGERRTENGEHKYHLVDTPAKFKEFLTQLKKQQRFAVDLETTGLDPLQAEIVGLAFSWQGGQAHYLAVRAPEGEPHLDPAKTLAQLQKPLEDAKIEKVNQNIKYDLLALRAHGVNVAGVAGDSMVADYLLHAGERSHSLDDLANRYLNHQVIPITDLIGKGKNQLRMDQVSTARVAEYSGEDADIAFRLCELLERKLEEQGLAKLYQEVEVPLIAVLADLEFSGVRLDVPLLRRLGEEMAGQLKGIEREIYELAGHEFNIASPKQLRTVLFDELKLPTQKRTGITGEASTDQETLERLAALGHELPTKIVAHRQVAKLKGTYVDALPDLVNPKTGRVHASFNQTVAATGRLSSSDPNLQNVPIRTEQGRQIRQAFLPEEGWSLLTADYSQIELRLLAHFTGDAALGQAFAEDRDIHTAVAAQIFGVAEKDVTGEMRRRAKTVNFGVIYGMSAVGLATRLGISREEAGKFIDAYFARYPKVLDYQTRLLNACRKTGHVGTILGRRRAITGIRSDSTYQQRNQPEREAINMEIQGSAADLIKLAMLRIHTRLKEEGRKARMLLQIHDELVFEAPPKELKAVAALVAEEMTTPLEKELNIQVPLKVDVAAGPNWLDVEEVAGVRLAG